ncbi:hypothetical protein [Streptomyces aidingensis]|uniref:hypothetical protein n=1 Tax=Streptomyces aidingensis TaxID=910347 RepID=UPI001587C422|nr:hypothetical protein [Streptomyces aidingensis]
MVDDDDFSFPGDLLAAQRRLSAAEAEHVALCRALPSRARTAAARRRAAAGGVPAEGIRDQAEQERRIRARVLELAERVHGHPYWDTLPPAERAAARGALGRRTSGGTPAPATLAA